MEIQKIKSDANNESQRYYGECEEVAKLIDSTQLNTHQDLKIFVEWVSEIKKQHRYIDDQRKKFTSSLKKVISELDTFFKPSLEILKTTESAAKEKIKTFIDKSLAKRDMVLEKVKYSKGEAKGLLLEADSINVPQIPGLSIREQWACQVENTEKLFFYLIDHRLHQFLEINEKALQEHVRSIQSDPKFPGLKAELKKTIAIKSN